jgi:hypothetical protein
LHTALAKGLVRKGKCALGDIQEFLAQWPNYCRLSPQHASYRIFHEVTAKEVFRFYSKRRSPGNVLLACTGS